MELIYNDEEFEKQLKRLNAIMGPHWQFKNLQARKDHIDFFGDNIDEGEIYFNRQYGAGYHEIIKLSRSSIEKFIFCLLNGNDRLTALGDNLIQEDFERMKKAMERVSISGTRRDIEE